MNQMQGKTFMFTGTLSVTRDEAQRIVEGLGGTAGSSLSKKTNYLVCGEDQVGKSDKFIRAGLLGVTRVDEEFFWEMVKESRGPEEEVLLSKEELEDFDNISEEKWKYVLSKNPRLLLMSESQFERLVGTQKKEEVTGKEEEMSWYGNNIEKWQGVRPKLGSRICPHCGSKIPYSINSNYWYCFKCLLFCDVGQEVAQHACVDWEITETGVESILCFRCKVCGNVKFEESADVDSARAWDSNFVHSVEFEAEVARRYVEVDSNVNTMADDSDKEAKDRSYQKWLIRQEKTVLAGKLERQGSASHIGEESKSKAVIIV